VTNQRSLFQRLASALASRFGRSELVALDRKVDRLSARLDQIAESLEQDAKWRSTLKRDVRALLRHQYLDELIDETSASDIVLNARRFRLRSQNEEDGIVLALLRAAGPRDRRFVEIGCGQSGGNSAVLALEMGWSGLMVDGSRKAYERASRTFQVNPGVRVVRAAVTPDNINDLLASHHMTGDLDFCSIDIDSYDYWLLEALTVCSPRVLVMEYNAFFGPEQAVTVPYGQIGSDAPKAYYGASLAALEALARRKGYRLVGCEHSGINAFFLRDDVARHVPTVEVRQAYRPAVDRADPAGEGLRASSETVLDRLTLPLTHVADAGDRKDSAS
jgi:predicted O-methyltransferase YrrM